MTAALRFSLALAALSLPLPLFASTVASYTAGTGTSQDTNYAGQEFIVTASGTYDDITFSFLAPNTGALLANGTGYLFSAPFTGNESALSTTTANLLGTATSSNGAWDFNSNLTLLGGTTYYFYEDFNYAAGTLAGGGGALSGTEDLFALNSSSPFITNGNGVSFNYVVSGTALPAATPEPESLVLLGTGVLAGVGMLRRRLPTGRA